MTEDAAAVARPENSAYVQVWADSLAQVVGQISGSAISCLIVPEAPAQLAGEKDLWLIVTSSGGLRGELALRLNPESALRAAQLFISEPATPGAEPTPEHREAVAELLRQVAGIVSSALKARHGEVTLRLDFMPGAPSWPASSTFWLRAGADETTAILLELQLSAALVAGLRTGAATETTVPPASAAPTPPAHDSQSEGKLALLMDVELALTLRFGGRNLLLRDVLELSPGAVVELDRQVQDPVDVLLDGRLVARGEVVVLGGNYGLRVTEVSPSGAI